MQRQQNIKGSPDGCLFLLSVNPHIIYVILTLNAAKVNTINSVTLVHIIICSKRSFPTHCYN
ncbi:hypothetical protein VDIAB_100349 [Vibrio diabolicus]|nr:hypothetical protein VDIAB_100349 [Vibrio diabolicus]